MFSTHYRSAWVHSANVSDEAAKTSGNASIAVVSYHILCLLVYKVLHGPAPVYIKSMCIPVWSSTARSSLRSASRGHLIVPRTWLEFGKRAFAFAGPTAWNSLPDIIRSAESIYTFKRLLESFLFSVSYPGFSFSVTACYTSSLY